MEKFDTSRHSVIDLESLKISPLGGLIEDALELLRSLEIWEDRLRGGDKKSQLYIARLATSSHSALDKDDPGNVFPISYDFPSFEFGSALIFYEAIQIFLNGLLIDMSEYGQRTKESSSLHETMVPLPNVLDLTAKSLECADRICQSVDYFFEANKRIIGRVAIMFPFESARALMARMAESGTGDYQKDALLGRKLMFCHAVAQRFQNEGLLVWQ